MANVTAIQSKKSQKYLSYVHDDCPQKGYVQASAPDSNSIYVKVELDPSKKEEGFVNIKSVSAKKFWVPVKVADTWWVVAQAEEPNEYLDTPESTLFKIHNLDDNTVQIQHANLDKYCWLKDASSQYPDCIALLKIGHSTDGKDQFTLF